MMTPQAVRLALRDVQDAHPSAIRTRLGELMLELPQVDGLGLHMTVLDRGAHRPVNVQTWFRGRQSDEITQAFYDVLPQVAYDPTTPEPVDTQCFRRWEDILGPTWRSHPVWLSLMAPLGVEDAARVLVYDDEEFALHVGTASLAPLRADTLGILQSIRTEISAVVAYAHRKDLELLERRPTMLVRADGNITDASDAAGGWLDPSRRSMVGSLVRRLDVRNEDDVEGFIDYARYRAVRLQGPTSSYVVMLDRPNIPRKAPTFGLTPRQQEVADLLAAGATIKEIAGWLGTAPSTVKTHTRAIYDKLGVVNRAELANAMRRDGH